MEGGKKKHFPSIQRNLDNNRQSETAIKSMSRFKEDDNQVLATTSDFTGLSTAGDINCGSADVRVRHLRKKKSEALQSAIADSGILKSSTTMSSISKISLEEQSIYQLVEGILAQDGARSVMQELHLTESQARNAVFDSIFMGALLRSANRAENREDVLKGLIYDRLRKHGNMLALKQSCENKQNRIQDLIENRLKKLAATLLQ